MAIVEVKVPDIGEFKEVAVIELMVKPGDVVAVDQSLVTVESDKASMEIPSSHAGVIKELRLAVGDKVSEGTLMALVEVAAGTGVAPSAPVAEPAAAPAAQAELPLVSAEASQPAAPAGAAIEVRVPDIGDFKDVAVIEVFVKPGDTVKAEQSLITVESDKASMEIPSSHAGVVQTVLVEVGHKINQGSPLLVLLPSGSTVLPYRLCPRRRRPWCRHRPSPQLGWLLLRLPRLQRRQRHISPAVPLWVCLMHRRRSANWRANSACRWPKWRAAAPKDASRRMTCKALSRT